jgi:hypothetical protein
VGFILKSKYVQTNGTPPLEFDSDNVSAWFADYEVESVAGKGALRDVLDTELTKFRTEPSLERVVRSRHTHFNKLFDEA